MEEIIVATGSDAVFSDQLLDAVFVTNRLLGYVVALLVVFAVFGLMKFIIRLVRDNITNYL